MKLCSLGLRMTAGRVRSNIRPGKREDAFALLTGEENTMIT